jgi:hypothetical protein
MAAVLVSCEGWTRSAYGWPTIPPSTTGWVERNDLEIRLSAIAQCWERRRRPLDLEVCLWAIGGLKFLFSLCPWSSFLSIIYMSLVRCCLSLYCSTTDLSLLCFLKISVIFVITFLHSKIGIQIIFPFLFVPFFCPLRSFLWLAELVAMTLFSGAGLLSLRELELQVELQRI